MKTKVIRFCFSMPYYFYKTKKYLEEEFDNKNNKIKLLSTRKEKSTSFLYSKYILFRIETKTGEKTYGLINAKIQEITIHPNKNLNISRMLYKNKYRLVSTRKDGNSFIRYGAFSEVENKMLTKFVFTREQIKKKINTEIFL